MNPKRADQDLLHFRVKNYFMLNSFLVVWGLFCVEVIDSQLRPKLCDTMNS